LLPNFDISLLKHRHNKTVTQEGPSRRLSSVSAALDRNSVAPFFAAIQNWIFTDMFESKRKKERTDELFFSEATRAILSFNVFSENAIYASAPFRTEPKRTYSPVEASSSAEGSHIPILLAQAKAFEKPRWAQIKTSLEDFGKQSGMFKKIDIKRLGNSTSDPFKLIISVSQDRSNIIYVGYGVSQILPIIVETMINTDAKFFIFQQSEVHLHPKAQAELSSYFAKDAIDQEKYLLLETHIYYVIDRIKRDMIDRKQDLSKYLSILFFEKHNLETTITRINLDERGNVLNPPKNCRNFFLNETIRTLGI